VAGREPQGALGEDEYDAFRDQIAEELAAIPDPDGNPLNTRVFKPEEVYSECKGIPPDLIVYFDDLFWRSVGTIGTGCLYAASNDTGPDDANHAQFGIFVLGGRQEATGEETGMSLLDVAPTALSLLGLSVPAGMQGVSLIGGSVESGNPSGTPDTPAQHAVAYTDGEKQIVEERLRSLGYL